MGKKINRSFVETKKKFCKVPPKFQAHHSLHYSSSPPENVNIFQHQTQRRGSSSTPASSNIFNIFIFGSLPFLETVRHSRPCASRAARRPPTAAAAPRTASRAPRARPPEDFRTSRPAVARWPWQTKSTKQYTTNLQNLKIVKKL